MSRKCLGSSLLPEKLSDQMKAGRRADALKSSVREHSSAAGKSGGGSLAGASLSVPRTSSGTGGGTGESNERRCDATSDTDTASAAGGGRMQRNRCPLSPAASWNTCFASRGASSDGARFSGERGSDAVVGRSEAGAAQLLGETCSSLAA